jgi:hypothetical protein
MADFGYIRVPYTHPGFPDIPLIEIFKENAGKRFDEGQQKLDDIATKIRARDGPKGESLRKRKNAINANKKQEGMMRFDAYFDSAAYEMMGEEIRKEVKRHMKDFMEESLNKSRDDTKRHIKGMDRKFKGKINPSKSAKGDLYDKIADSLKWEKKVSTRQPNQFTGYVAGSYDGGSPTGVKGSRGANLIEILGMGGFQMNTQPLGGTKRHSNSAINALKGR